MNSYNILVIDDERFILDIFSQFLCGEGYNVQSVQSNDDAIQYLKKKSFDLILIDFHMKGMSFKDFISYIRSLSDTSIATTPIIAITGVPDSIPDDLRSSIQGVIEKPFSPELLIESIRVLLVDKVLTV